MDNVTKGDYMKFVLRFVEKYYHVGIYVQALATIAAHLVLRSEKTFVCIADALLPAVHHVLLVGSRVLGNVSTSVALAIATSLVTAFLATCLVPRN